MRSMNVKRVAAIATGAAMIGSVFAISAFGAVQTQGDVTGLITKINNNLGDTQVVLGTNGAAVSDGIAAAKLAATLATKNYAPASTASGATVTVQSSTTGGGVTITPSIYTLEMQPGYGNVSTVGGYKTTVGNVTLTPLQLGDILSKKTLSAYLNGSVQTFQYQEEINFGPTGFTPFVQYHESGPTPPGHGLFLSAPYGSIQYKLNFQASGQGIPTQGSAYNVVPSVTVLGSNYAIDTTQLTSGNLVLYSGTRQEILEGQSVTVGNATIAITSVGQITSTSGTTFSATVKVDRAGVSDTQSVQRLSGFDFFAAGDASQIVTVYLEEIIYGASGGSKVIARIGSNKVRIQVGQQFPLDPNWNIASIGITGNLDTNGLTSVVLQYGNPSTATAFGRGTFDGTVTNGLATGLVVPGPMNANGQSLWGLKLVGYGGATQTDSTQILYRGVGSNSSSNSLMQVTWTDRDGIKNEFAPPDRTFANASGLNTSVGLVLGTTPYTVLNDKVVYFSGINQQASGTSTQYTPVFKIGGVNGFTINGATVTSASAPSITNNLTSKLEYTGGISGNVLRCAVNITGVNSVLIAQNTTCSTTPTSIVVGSKTVFDRATSPSDRPALNLNFSGTTGTSGAYGIVNYSGGAGVAFNPRPVVWVTPVTGGVTSAVVFDDSSTASGSDTNTGTGMQVYGNVTAPTGALANVSAIQGAGGGTNFSTSAPGITAYIDQAKTTPYEQDYWHIGPGGSVFDGSQGGQITDTVYEALPSTVLQIGNVGTSVTNASVGSTQTVAVGGTIGGVKILGINVGANAYTTKVSVDPSTLVATDTSATKTYKVVVGGPYVNRIAGGMAAASLITQAGSQYLVAEGNNLLVAGYLGTDTTAAADQLITLLKA